MGVKIDYPRSNLKNCLMIASAVHELGGHCSVESAADRLNKKGGGAFQALYSSAVRYGMLSSAKGQLTTTEKYREYKLAYNSDEEKRILGEFFLTPPLFNAVFERFEGIELPLSHFEKLLIREFEVPDNMASRVSKYFVEGAKLCYLLGTDNILRRSENAERDNGALTYDALEDTSPTSISAHNLEQSTAASSLGPKISEQKSSKGYSVRISGPGIDSLIEINEAEDLTIVQAMLNKVAKKITHEET